MEFYVYLVQAGDYVKIGHSHNPDKRVDVMQTGSPHKLKVLARLPFKTKRAAMDYEKELHTRLKRHHYRGEWFYSSCISEAFKAPKPKMSKKIAERGGNFPKTKRDSRWIPEEEMVN